MTVSSTTNKHSYNGNGSQAAFAYTFKVFADADIKVYVGTALQSLNTHYTLSGVGSSSGGNVTFTSGNIPASGSGNVTLLRSLALTQGVDLINYGKFDAEVVEAQYDKLTMMVQQLQEQADRTIRFSTTVSDAGGVEITDTVAQRSGKVLAYDANGDLSVANELGDWQGDWSTASVYAVRDLVLDAATNNVYTCLAGHTAGTLASDVTANKWALVINASAVAASATSAANSATAAATSATTATTQASTATTKASEASTSASNASTSETNAASSASTASTKATEASTSASNASTSETNAGNSASSASTSASTATTQANTATTKASQASTSATNSASSATASASSASTATTQASTATTQASNAASSASSASGSASTATTQASTATTKANEAATSASNAAVSAASAASAFDSFDDRYLGAKASAPTTDNDGDPLQTGNLYFLTGTGMQVWDGAAWIAASSSGNVSMYVFEFTATAGQTTFSGSDTNGQALSYTAGNIHVTYGGLDLPTSDYTATSGTSIVLADGAEVGKIVRIVAFESFVVADTYTKAEVDSKDALKAPLASPSFTGTVVADGLTVGGGGLTSLGNIGSFGDGTAGVQYTIKSSNTGSGTIDFGDVADSNIGRIQYDHSDDSLMIRTNNTEAMRIDSSGNLLVGKTALNGNTTGFQVEPAGAIAVTRSGSTTAYFNRQTSDGEIVAFRKDGTTVGSWKSRAGLVSSLVLDPRAANNGCGIGATDGLAIVATDNTGAIVDSDKDLGQSGVKWRDLYLSGGVYLGGTASANKLDDYEEGTFTATLVGPNNTTTGRYTKVGNLVTFALEFVAVNTAGYGTHITVNGLPFTTISAPRPTYSAHTHNVNLNGGTHPIAMSESGGSSIAMYGGKDSSGWVPLYYNANTIYLAVSGSYHTTQ